MTLAASNVTLRLGGAQVLDDVSVAVTPGTVTACWSDRTAPASPACCAC